MTATPPPDWTRIPGAGRAHLINPSPSPNPTPPENRPGRAKAFLTKPLVWILGLLLAAIGGFVVNYLSKALETAALQATTEPVFVYDVQRIEPPARDLAGWVVPGSHTDVDYPDRDWLDEHESTASGWGAWEVVIEGKRDTMITIVDIRAEDIECTDPTGGTQFIHITQGEAKPSNLGITIDAPSPSFKVFPDDWPLIIDPDPDAAMASFPAYGEDTLISLEPAEQHVIRFFAHAAERTCTWKVALEYTADGTHKTAVLDPEGRHAFALAALLPTEDYEIVVLPFVYCEDMQGRALPGEEAAAIIAEVQARDGLPTDCP